MEKKEMEKFDINEFRELTTEEIENVSGGALSYSLTAVGSHGGETDFMGDTVIDF